MIAGTNRKGNETSLNGQVIGGQRVYDAAGSLTAGPIWGDTMKAIQRWLPDKRFHAPPTRLVRGKQITVPDVRGVDAGTAADLLRTAGLQPQTVHGQNGSGRVVTQHPDAGTQVTAGSTVTLRTSG